MTDTEPTPERPLPGLPNWERRPPESWRKPRNPWVTVGIVLSVSLAVGGLFTLAIALFVSALSNMTFSNK